MLLAVVLATIGTVVGVGVPAQAATTTVCANLGVPAGFYITNIEQAPAGCGYFAKYTVTTDLYDGMSICAQSLVPAGWVVTHAQSMANCANANRNTITSRLSNGMAVCSTAPLPTGWVATNAQEVPSCGGKNRLLITSSLYSGMSVCVEWGIPPGWYLASAQAYQPNCWYTTRGTIKPA
ncbi:hypothetical protein [Micromonospora cathayae]|uniref:Secreted protein n=1 Tax=Micromonospora cathayae TaxID=3028804 RepID=A0ABY7ZNR4_9ACTN|nr:hypothetical protein [Micromonospora sp. HUAS 3]WDZ84493.1 hypothetical protein PVK37_29340 [Micromonospora sp. HUAS 3]